MTCTNLGASPEWSPSVTCIAQQCKKPDIANMESLSEDKENYAIRDNITVRCKSGYYPSSGNMTCTNPGASPEWSPSVTCIGITMMDVTVTSTRISFWISCDPQCPDSWRFIVDRYNVGTNSGQCDIETRTVTCSGLQPSSNYTIRSTIYINGGGALYTKEMGNISTKEAAKCKRPEIPNLTPVSGDRASYDVGESIDVQCVTGYRASHKRMTCVTDGDGAKWDHTPECIEMCKKTGKNKLYSFSSDKPFYALQENVTVLCNDVSYRSQPQTIQCVKKVGKRNDWNESPRCVERCRRPEVDNMQRLSRDEKYYNTNEKLTINCKAGYYPPSVTLTCVNRGARDEWDKTATCRERCRRPEVDNMQSLSSYKKYYDTYYDTNETLTINCKAGYYPPSVTLTCVNRGARDEWDKNATCRERCRRPWVDNMQSISSYKMYYDTNKKLTISCKAGYFPPSVTLTCVNRGARDEWDANAICRARCRRPEVYNMQSISSNKMYYDTYYDTNETLTIYCKDGYFPPSETLTCVSRGDRDEWDKTAICRERCRRPVVENMQSISRHKKYYDTNEKLTINCKAGYYPPSVTLTCVYRGARDEWDANATCRDVKVTNVSVTSSSISLRISCAPQCPDSWRYRVCHYLKDKGSRKCGYFGSSVELTGLQPYSLYTVTTNITFSGRPYTLQTTDIRTNETAPDSPKVTQKPSMKEPTMKWSLSADKGPITGFRMSISAWRDYNLSFSTTDSLWFSGNVTEYKVPLLYGTNYTLTLQGFTEAGAGEATTESVNIDIGDPPRHMEKTIKDQTLQLHPVPNLHGPISNYQIIVFIDQERNRTDDCLRFSDSVYNASRNPSNYTAAFLPAENLTESQTFILGDNQYYKGFHNAPFTPGHNYSVYIRVNSCWGKNKKFSCAFAGFLDVQKPANSSAQIVAGSLAAAVLLLILILVVVWRIRLSRKPSRSSDMLLKAQAPAGKKKRDIPVDGLLNVVKSFRIKELQDTEDDEENSNILPVGRYLEYKEFPSGLLYPCTVAQKTENQAKNRYKKVLAYDNCRVVLRSSPSGSDYINASYINLVAGGDILGGYLQGGLLFPQQDVEFSLIIYGGPLQQTVADFWRMVWQENSSVIVMLTGLEEKNKVKCERYWPEQSHTYGDITVSLQKVNQTGAITIRSFSLKKAASVVQMTVEQLHYLRWPDHGVPRNSSDMVQLIDLMNKCNTPGSGPIIVHCSAGIGRTGTLLALDILLKRARAVRKVNVYNCVLELRKARVNMVQEKEQYVFLYNVLLETLQCGVTSIPVSEIQRRAQNMAVRDPGTNMTGYEKEFQALERLNELYQITVSKEGKKLENRDKNHDPNILPGDDCRPVLMSILTRQGSPGYINAVFVNSNSQEDLLITTQLPMKQTLVDFWALVWDYKCTAVVMMQSAKDLQKTCPRFWPDKGEVSFGTFRVRMIMKKGGDGYSGLVLGLRKNDEASGSSLEVKLWQLDSWPLDRPLPEKPGALITLIGEAERCQQQTPDSHILVTCFDGASRSGLLCAGMILCDQIRSDDCVDVSQAVRSIRKRRCQFIPSVDQYSFCHTLAQSYLDSFETYSNFR